MAFAACINLSAMDMRAVSEGFNTVYTVVTLVVLAGWPPLVTVKFVKAMSAIPNTSTSIYPPDLNLYEGGEQDDNQPVVGKPKKGKKAATTKKQKLARRSHKNPVTVEQAAELDVTSAEVQAELDVTSAEVQPETEKTAVVDAQFKSYTVEDLKVYRQQKLEELRRFDEK